MRITGKARYHSRTGNQHWPARARHRCYRAWFVHAMQSTGHSFIHRSYISDSEQEWLYRSRLAGWRSLTHPLAAYRRGDITEAFAALSDIGDIEDPGFYVYRASLKLSVGRSVAAISDLDRALALRAGDARALALKSIILTTQNEPEAALTLAQQAINKIPRLLARISRCPMPGKQRPDWMMHAMPPRPPSMPSLPMHWPGHAWLSCA